MNKFIIKMIGQVMVGMSIVSMQYIGLWFVLPWLLSWIIYDLHYDL